MPGSHAFRLVRTIQNRPRFRTRILSLRCNLLPPPRNLLHKIRWAFQWEVKHIKERKERTKHWKGMQQNLQDEKRLLPAQKQHRQLLSIFETVIFMPWWLDRALVKYSIRFFCLGLRTWWLWLGFSGREQCLFNGTSLTFAWDYKVQNSPKSFKDINTVLLLMVRLDAQVVRAHWEHKDCLCQVTPLVFSSPAAC